MVVFPYTNILRELLNEDKPTIGTHLRISWPFITELVGLSGSFDYIDFLGYSSPYTDFGLENIARTAESYGMSSMIKIDQNPRIYLAERALAAGIPNILFTDVRNAEEVKLCVDAVRPDPKGINGATGGRIMSTIGGWGKLPDWVKYCEDAVVAIMIEKKEAVENLEEILSVEGVDMVQFGPGDYSQSIGIPAQWTHPKIRAAEDKVIKLAQKMDIRPIIECSVEAMQRYVERGCRDFFIGIDTTILSNWYNTSGKKIRKTLSKR